VNTILTDVGKALFTSVLPQVARYEALTAAIEELERHYYELIWTVEVSEGYEEGYVAGIDQAVHMLKTMRDQLSPALPAFLVQKEAE